METIANTLVQKTRNYERFLNEYKRAETAFKPLANCQNMVLINGYCYERSAKASIFLKFNIDLLNLNKTFDFD